MKQHFDTNQTAHILKTKNQIEEFLYCRVRSELYVAVRSGNAVVGGTMFNIFLRDQSRDTQVAKYLPICLLDADEYSGNMSSYWLDIIKIKQSDKKDFPGIITKPRTWDHFIYNNTQCKGDISTGFSIESHSRGNIHPARTRKSPGPIRRMIISVEHCTPHVVPNVTGIILYLMPFKTREELREAYYMDLTYSEENLFLTKAFYDEEMAKG